MFLKKPYKLSEFNAALYYKAAGGGGGGTTLNPLDKDSNTTLSPGNLTATASGSGSWTGVRATVSKSTGKFYYEVHFDSGPSGGAPSLGIANANSSLSVFNGFTNDGIGYFVDGNVRTNNNSVATMPTYANGDTICIATDLTDLTIFFRLNAGNWNNNGTANPTTNTGGISLSTLNAGPYFPDVSGDTNTVFTANFGATTYAQTQPSGFGNWV